MKRRVLKTIALVMTLVLCMGMSVFAEDSKEADTPVTGGDSEDVIINIGGTDESHNDAMDALEDIIGDNETILDVKDVTVEGDAKFPIKVTFDVEGVTENTKGYVMIYVDGEWIKLDTVCGNGTMTAWIPCEGLVAFVIEDGTTSAGTKSPQTSASVASLVALAGLSAGVAACGLKKKNN